MGLHEDIREGSEKRRIWSICDELERKTGRIPSGTEVVAIYVAEGGNRGTGQTQYSHWKKAREAQIAAARPDNWFEAGLESAGPLPVTIAADGSMTIPASLAQAMFIAPDGKATAEVVDGQLRLTTWRAGVKRAQKAAAALGAGAGVADELIAERRAEAAQEADT